MLSEFWRPSACLLGAITMASSAINLKLFTKQHEWAFEWANIMIFIWGGFSHIYNERIPNEANNGRTERIITEGHTCKLYRIKTSKTWRAGRKKMNKEKKKKKLQNCEPKYNEPQIDLWTQKRLIVCSPRNISSRLSHSLENALLRIQIVKFILENVHSCLLVGLFWKYQVKVNLLVDSGASSHVLRGMEKRIRSLVIGTMCVASAFGYVRQTQMTVHKFKVSYFGKNDRFRTCHKVYRLLKFNNFYLYFVECAAPHRMSNSCQPELAFTWQSKMLLRADIGQPSGKCT